ncbi:MAG: haloacid dehalogenase type II [Elusimicrobia bacterium]|nr:haloacid dehalogenase type II [Elusimicrobiota bacterium]
MVSPTRPYDLVTFDCYGTLIDWEGGMSQALERLGRELGVSVDTKPMVRRYIQLELGLEQSSYRRYRDILRLGLSALFKERGINLSASASRSFARSLAEWRPFPETAATLRRLRAAGYRTAVLSNVDDALLRRSLRRIGVPFDFKITAESVRSYKPSVRHWERLLSVSGVPKRRVLHVAASLVHDIIPAKTLGLAAVWINRHGERALPGAAPRQVFKDLKGLVPLLS